MNNDPHSEEVDRTFRRLRELLDEEKAKNTQLRLDIQEAEQRALESLERAAEADRRARETQEKLSILEDLKKKQYQQVVTELFKQPSRRAAILTVTVAVISIIVGVMQTMIVGEDSLRNQSRIVEEMARLMDQQMDRRIKESEGRTLGEFLRAEEKTNSRLTTSEKNSLDLIDGIYRAVGIPDLQRNVSISSLIAIGSDRYYRVLIPRENIQTSSNTDIF